MPEEKNEETVNVESTVAQAVSAVRGMLLFEGILIALAGLVLVISPLASLAVITTIIGIFMIVNSIFRIITAAKLGGPGRTMAIAYGALILLLGVFTVMNPVMMNAVWILLVGVWQLVVGITTLIGKGRPGATMISGALSAIVGVALILFPILGLVSLVWIAGLFLMISGIMMLISVAQLKA